VKLTETAIAKLKPGKTGDLVVFDNDLPGFGLRVRAGGSRSWIYQYKIGDQHRRITLGKYPALQPVQARKTAAKLHAEVRLGNDPAAEKAEKQIRASETFGAILKNYLTRRQGQVRASSLAEITRHLERNLSPLHGFPLDKIDRRTIAVQLSRITHESGPTQANRTRASLSKFLNWAIGEGLIENNPVQHTNKNIETTRDRVLSDNELKAIWSALADDSDYSTIVKLLMLTGQRANEIAGLRWSEVVFERDIIALPGSRTKNHRAHIIAMASMVRVLLEARPQNGRDFVFGIGQGGFSGWSRAKARLDDSVKLAPWTVHDVRRSVCTKMAEIGIAPHIVEAVVNHASGKSHVAGIYNRHGYESEKAAALKRWAKHLAKVLS
jgi:integrase